MPPPPVSTGPVSNAGSKRHREPSPTPVNSNVGNPLMAVYAIAMMEMKKQSFVRSAGSVGVDIYEEVAAQGLAGTHLELPTGMDGSDDRKRHVPFRVRAGLQTTCFDDDVLFIAPSGVAILANHKGVIQKGVKFVHLSGFKRETATCPGFVAYYSSLTAIDLSPLLNVTTIHSSFMQGCTSLTAIDMSPLSKVTSIGWCFMSACTSLVSIKMSGLTNVKTIEENFMSGCTALGAIDLSELVSVVTLGYYFMRDCFSLTDVSLPPYSRDLRLDSSMFSRCTSLQANDNVKKWRKRSKERV